MTMLDRMRRHKGWLKWSLAIVILAFIVLYIPSFLKQDAARNNDVVASVEGRDITVGRFRQAYQRQMQAYRAQFGGNVDERMLKQLGIDQRIVQQMIEEETGLAEASRLGISATDEEVRTRIATMPGLLENGQFIGEQRYRQLLQMQNPPMTAHDFEEQIRRGVTLEKLRAALTNWMTLTDKELEDEFKRRNEKVKLAVVSFPADKFREGLDATDAELTAYYEAHKSELKIPEKRKVKYALVDMQAIRNRIQISPQDIQREYDDKLQQYSTPEQVRATHILLKTEGKDDAAVKKQAEDLLAQLKKGASFEDLAKKNSQDEVSAAKGGDLDYFNKGQMVPEFDKAAFTLPIGQLSDLVKSSFGYHIIKVADRKPASTKTLAEVRPQIEDQLKYEQAQAAAQKLADQVAGELKKPSDFDSVGRARGLQGGESGLFTQDEPIAGIGMAPAVTQQAFQLKEGEVSEPLRTPQGYAFITVTGKQAPYVPKVEEVKTKVRDDVLKLKAIEAARQKAAAINGEMKSGDFEKAAKAAGLEVKTTELIARGSPMGDAGVSPALEAAAFALPAGGVSAPVVTDNGAAIVKVVERKDVAPEELAKQKDSLRNELLNERKNKFFASYMTKARQRMKVNINRETIAQIVG